MFSRVRFFDTYQKKYDTRVLENRFKIGKTLLLQITFFLQVITKHQNRFSAPIKSPVLPSTTRLFTNTCYVFFLHRKNCFHVNLFTY